MSSQRSTSESAEEARQGVTGHNVRYVLLISCCLVVALMIAIFALFAYMSTLAAGTIRARSAFGKGRDSPLTISSLSSRSRLKTSAPREIVHAPSDTRRHPHHCLECCVLRNARREHNGWSIDRGRDRRNRRRAGGSSRRCRSRRGGWLNGAWAWLLPALSPLSPSSSLLLQIRFPQRLEQACGLPRPSLAYLLSPARHRPRPASRDRRAAPSRRR